MKSAPYSVSHRLGELPLSLSHLTPTTTFCRRYSLILFCGKRHTRRERNTVTSAPALGRTSLLRSPIKTDIDPKFIESSAYVHFPTAILTTYRRFTKIVWKLILREDVCRAKPQTFPHCLTLTSVISLRIEVCRLYENGLSMEVNIYVQ